MTTTPGKESHTLFGHCALRIVDQNNDFDKIYNFGLFDFNAPYFPIKFLGGNLNYWLGRQTVEGFIDINNKEKRLIKEQVLRLSADSKAAIFKRLKERHRSEEDKYYRYAFIDKNCATEIRDIFIAEGIISVDYPIDQSYRELLNAYTEHHKWFRFGINILMGSSVDRRASHFGAMFLPAYLEQSIAEKEGLVTENNTLNNPDPIHFNSFLIWLCSPILLFSLLLILTFFWSPNWFRKVIYGLMGTLGVLLIWLWSASLHTEFADNYNILWANPLFLSLIPLKKKSTIKRYPLYILFASLAFAIIFWLLGLQEFDLSVIPLIALLTHFLLKDLKT